MAFAAGKKSTFFLFMEAYGLEVEEGLTTMVTQFGAQKVWTGNGVSSRKKLG